MPSLESLPTHRELARPAVPVRMLEHEVEVPWRRLTPRTLDAVRTAERRLDLQYRLRCFIRG